MWPAYRALNTLNLLASNENIPDEPVHFAQLKEEKVELDVTDNGYQPVFTLRVKFEDLHSFVEKYFRKDELGPPYSIIRPSVKTTVDILERILDEEDQHKLLETFGARDLDEYFANKLILRIKIADGNDLHSDTFSCTYQFQHLGTPTPNVSRRTTRRSKDPLQQTP